jgi:hypothetical protein
MEQARPHNQDGILRVIENFSKKGVMLHYKGKYVDTPLEARLPMTEAIQICDERSYMVL